MTPVFIWFLARIIREVKRMQEGVAMGVGVHRHTEIDAGLGYAFRRTLLDAARLSTDKDLPLESVKQRTSDWQLNVAQWLFVALLLGTHRSYQARLQTTRIAESVDLEEFRGFLGKILDEWTGK